MLYRQFYTWANTFTLRTVHMACIRPHSEYAAQLWDPCNKKDNEALESVKKFACKVCLKIWDMSYDDMLHLLNLPPLHARRRYLSQCLTSSLDTCIPHKAFSFLSSLHKTYFLIRLLQTSLPDRLSSDILRSKCNFSRE